MVNDSPIAVLGAAMAREAVTSVDLVEASQARILAEDPAFNAVGFLNPDAERIATERDLERAVGHVRGPLHGVPILIKDNIASGDAMMTSAGSLALDGVRAGSDSHLVRRLRDAGAVLIGKTNLSEWANFRSTRSASGWSSRGGQVRNAYATDRTPGGSSSGSAVAVARGYVSAAIGTETDGSIVGPAAMNSLVGIKPSLGLVSRNGIIPIAMSQDTAGPMACTVTDAAAILTAIAGPDPDDPATATVSAPDFSRFLDSGALRGARIGVARGYCGFHEGVDRVFEAALAVLRDAGTIVIDDVVLPSRDDIRPYELIVMLCEFKVGLNAWLGATGPDCPVRSLADLIAFNEANAATVMPYFGQELLYQASETNGLEDRVYRKARAICRRLAGANGIDRAMQSDRLDGLVAPTSPVPWAIDLINGDNRLGGSSTLAAVSGYASVTVPAGYVAGLPVGLSFIGGPLSDGQLIGYAYAFEQAARIRVAPGPPRPWMAGAGV